MLASLLVAVVLSGSASDPLAAAWKARAARATEKLSKPGLDACDRALEVAFQSATTDRRGGQEMYALAIRIGEDVMLAGYSYRGGKLVDFSIYGLPPQWMAHQKVDSKTLSVVLGRAPGCAFDLCTTDPFSDGPCTERTR
ncbi:MAG: hypothetical protein Q8L48_05010 [Archangium sp.]|nr:hypothetical protein [Archangium sp.]